MADKALSTLLRYLRRRAQPRGGSLSDSQLLERFVAQHDEAAFELLVWRHGPMVLNVCRRLLAGTQDAEDAFQATFLIFVRKAHAIFQPEGVAGWLYWVAYRVALRARGGAAKRARHEKPGVDLDTMAGSTEPGWSDLRPVLDEEISRLPERHRLPVVLCYLEGRTYQEAAEHLGCAEGTVASRLARARERLRGRLVRRGLTLGAGALGVALSGDVASAAMTPALVESTKRAGLASSKAVALAEGVLHTMWFKKVRIAVAVLLLAGAAGLGAGGLAYQGQAAEQRLGPPAIPFTDPAQAAKGPVAKEDETLKNTLVALVKASNDAAVNQDVGTYGKFLADDYVGFSGQNRYTKEDCLRGVVWAQNGIEFKMTDVELVRLNDKAAVLSFKGQWKVVSKEGEVLLRRNRRVSYCWVQRGGGWVIAFSQDIVIGPE